MEFNRETMTKKTPLKVAFIGGGASSAVGYAHFTALRMDNLWHLEAGVFSLDPVKNIESAKLYGVALERVYDSLDELLNKEKDRLDAVIVLTPTPMHHKTVIKCLEARIPVICEKALSTSPHEAENIKLKCAETGGFLSVIYNYSGYPMVREMRKFIDEGRLGRILHFQAEMPQEGFVRIDKDGNRPKLQEWRLYDDLLPTLHLDLAVHLHELIYYLTREKPLEVIADQSTNGWFNVVDNVMCMTRYTNNVKGQFWFSKSALGNRNGLKLRIYGSNASLEWLQTNPEELLVSYTDGSRFILDRASSVSEADAKRYSRFKAGHPAGFNEALANLYTDLFHALNYYRETGKFSSNEVFGVDLALEGLHWLEAMVNSANFRHWVSVQH